MLKKLTLVPVFTVIFSQLLWAAPVSGTDASDPLLMPESGSGSAVSESGSGTGASDPLLMPESGSGSAISESGSGSALTLDTTNKAKEGDKEAADNLARKLDAIRTISARFKQDAIAADGRLTSESGKMQMKRPGRFRWITELPYEQEIIARDDKVWMIDKDLQQVIIQKQDERMANTPAQLLSGNASELLKRYRVSVFTKPDVQKFTLLPEGESDLFEKLDITFRLGVLESMELKDSLGGRRRISFTDVNANGMISSSRFKVSIPKGFDVIDETGL